MAKPCWNIKPKQTQSLSRPEQGLVFPFQAEMALKLSLNGILADLGLDSLLGVHLSETRILSLKLFEPLNHRVIHAATLGVPLIYRAAMLTLWLSTAPQPSLRLPPASE